MSDDYFKLASDCLPRRDGSLPSGVRTQLSLAQSHIMHRLAHLGLPTQNAELFIDQAASTATKLVDLCESPIEAMLLPWLLVEDYGPRLITFPARGFNHRIEDAPPPGDVIVAPQLALVRYRVDFAVMARLGRKTKIVLVECDGENFHGAMRDRRRDTCLSGLGFETIRASGADIYARPRNVSARVAALLQEWAEAQ